MADRITHVDGVEYRFFDVDRSLCAPGCVVAFDNDEPVGKIEFGFPSTSSQRLYQVVCGWLIVSDTHQRKGIATELFRQFIEWTDGRTVWVDTTPAGRKFVKAYIRRFGKVAGLRGFR